MSIKQLTYLIGAGLAIVGSFSPWVSEGDLVTYTYNGLYVSPQGISIGLEVSLPFQLWIMVG